MTGDLDHDPLELGRSDKSIIVRIEISECLTDTFSPETLEELGEFLETDNMVTTAFTKV